MKIQLLLVFKIILQFKYFRALPISCLDRTLSLFTKCMQQFRFREANFSSADQEMP